MKKNYPKYVEPSNQTKKINNTTSYKKPRKSLKQVIDLLKKTKLPFYYI